MLLRCLSVFLLLTAYVDAQDSEKLSSLFTENLTNNKKSVDGIRCSGITGSLKGCYDCYLCDEPQIDTHRRKNDEIFHLGLIDGSCASTDICCVSHISLTPRTRNKCGIPNINGYPRKLRNFSREVLRGEYPWQSWVYLKSDLTKPLCAATCVSDVAKVVITSASCVSGKPKDSLFVVFERDPYSKTKVGVKSVIINDKFEEETHDNDIALLDLGDFPPSMKWVKPACLPTTPPQLSLPCITFSNDAYLINMVIPNQESCAVQNTSILPTLLCAATHKSDLTPEYGSGLFALEQDVTTPTYQVYGIQLQKSGDSLSVYTNIASFSTWIEQKIQLILMHNSPTHGYGHYSHHSHGHMH